MAICWGGVEWKLLGSFVLFVICKGLSLYFSLFDNDQTEDSTNGGDFNNYNDNDSHHTTHIVIPDLGSNGPLLFMSLKHSSTSMDAYFSFMM